MIFSVSTGLLAASCNCNSMILLIFDDVYEPNQGTKGTTLGMVVNVFIHSCIGDDDDDDVYDDISWKS